MTSRPRVASSPPRARWMLVLLLSWACGQDAAPGPSPIGTVVDLRATFAASVHRPRTTRIRPGDPAGAVGLAHGWSAPETRADGDVAVHLLAPVGALTFVAGAISADQEIAIRVSDVRSPTVIDLNGRRLGRLPLGRTAPGVVRTTVLSIPAARQRPGVNTLTLRTGRRRGREREAPWLLLHDVSFTARQPAPILAELDVATGALVLRPGAQIDLFARAPADVRLRWTQLGSPVPLDMTVTPDGGAERRLPVEASGDVALDVAAGTALRVRLAVPARGDTVRLSALDIVGRLPVPPAPRPHAAPTSVLLYVADTLRADGLGAYGNVRGTSPHLDALSRTAVTFERTVAASSWTRPSTATLLTGVSPAEHGALTLRDPIRPGVARVAAAFDAAGYATGAFVTNVNVADRFGFGDGFDVYRYLPEEVTRAGIHAPAADLHAAALSWLDEQQGGPFFLYLHATDTHAPYAPAPATAARFVPTGLSPAFAPDASLSDMTDHLDRVTPDDVRTLRGRYDAEVAELDDAFGALVSALRHRGLWDRLLVVVVADHGEEFFEHGGLEHGRTLYREVLDVPLIVRLPGDAGGGRRVDTLARHLDVAPTMLALAGVEPSPSMPGRVLVDARGAPTTAPAGEAIAETYLGRDRLQALVTPHETVIVDGRDDGVRVFDLHTDPGETRNRSAERPILAGYARQVLDEAAPSFAWAGGGASPAGRPSLDKDTAERLRALGYLHD